MNELQPEILAYEREESRVKRILFLVNNRAEVGKQEIDGAVDMEDVRDRILENFYIQDEDGVEIGQGDTTFDVPSHYQQQYEKDLKVVESLNEEFPVIDKLVFLLYILKYTKLKAKEGFTSQHRIKFFKQLKILYQGHKK